MTPAQAAVYHALVTLADEKGYPPSIREVMLRAGLKSPSTAMVHLYALRAQGRVSWVEGRNRTLTASRQGTP